MIFPQLARCLARNGAHTLAAHYTWFLPMVAISTEPPGIASWSLPGLLHPTDQRDKTRVCTGAGQVRAPGSPGREFAGTGARQGS